MAVMVDGHVWTETDGEFATNPRSSQANCLTQSTFWSNLFAVFSRERREESQDVPLRAALESRFGAKIVTFDDDGITRPGGMCRCCGGGPNVDPDWRGDPWYVYQEGICDSDGVYYSMLCEGCLEELRIENHRRIQTERDEIAEQVNELMSDDLDGAQTFMDDLM